MPTQGQSRPSLVNLVDGLEAYFQRYLALKPGLALVLALWAIATHLFQVFDTFPYLAITSPTKRCGKTRASDLLGFVCAKARCTVGISVAALYRVIEKEKPTLIIDEAESLRDSGDRASALREILNAGYRKGLKVIRCGPHDTNFATQEFQTFCPKVLVLIRNLPDTLADRCIPINMTRRTAHEKLERFRLDRVEREAKPLRERIERWAKRNRKAVASRFEGSEVPFLQDREEELWLPIFVVCGLAAPYRRAELETVARRCAAEKAADEPGDLGIRLLADIREVFEMHRANRLASADLVNDLNRIADSPWPAWSRGRGLNARGLSVLLRPFSIRPQNIRERTGVFKGYPRESFKDAWDAYVLPPCATPLQRA